MDVFKTSRFDFLWRTRKRRLIAAAVVLVLAFGAWIIYLGKDLPSFDQLENYDPQLATKVYSADGVLIKEFFTERRVYTPLTKVPELVIKSILATEDHRFYQHWGVVPIRLLKVFFTDWLTGRKQAGASSLTQQLARGLYLTPEKTVTRKIREIITAIQLEHTYTKSEILEMYVNHLQFGYSTYGIESAASYFFDKDIAELTLPEIALLTGMLQRPGALNPRTNPEAAMRRRNVVLARMADKGFITKEEMEAAANSELGVREAPPFITSDFAAYFTEYIRQNLQNTYGMDLYKGGMNIYTTLDTRVQAEAEKAVMKYLPDVQSVAENNLRRRDEFIKLVPPSILRKTPIDLLLKNKHFADSLINEKGRVQVSLLALDPRNGHILAMIGGRSFHESQFNRAVQARRQPGSAFKPFVYTAAVDNGYMPCYEKLNQPIVVQMADGSRWTPQNYDLSIGGKTTLRDGLKYSLNLVTARLVQEDVPPEEVISYARHLGITTPLEAVDAIALGAIGVVPLEITSAFGAFANRGVLAKPMSVIRVEDRYGNILERTIPQSKGVLREETAYIMANMLQTAATSGTGAASRSVYNFLRPAGAKTGTTNDFTDAWYITFTPQMVVSVWVGLDDPALSLGKRQSGAKAALPMAVTTIKAAYDTLQLPVEDFVRPEGVVELEVCKDTKLLATNSCPNVIREIFDVRYQPVETCNVHTGDNKNNKSNSRRKIRF